MIFILEWILDKCFNRLLSNLRNSLKVEKERYESRSNMMAEETISHFCISAIPPDTENVSYKQIILKMGYFWENPTFSRKMG